MQVELYLPGHLFGQIGRKAMLTLLVRAAKCFTLMYKDSFDLAGSHTPVTEGSQVQSDV